MNPHAGSLDDASDRLLAQLKSSDSDREELYRTLLVKLRFLTNGAILSEGGVSIIRQAYMFIEHQPQVRDAYCCYCSMCEVPLLHVAL